MLYKENDTFYFKYILENVKEAQARLPDKRSPEIDKILEEYGMTEYNEFVK